MSGLMKYIVKVNLAIAIVVLWIVAAYFALPILCSGGRCTVSISSFLTL